MNTYKDGADRADSPNRVLTNRDFLQLIGVVVAVIPAALTAAIFFQTLFWAWVPITALTEF